ncbi:hypothetical protein MKW98_029084 [Papaver atlanticum]|uniref:Uncharacterized protein n=1 Tax=Papaver atlanticum TaxID=357466 RepID=A0AAD4S9V5_9MAGN|nr:hypothetical protein MKW98_029084 [Papaver atlanticum]
MKNFCQDGGSIYHLGTGSFGDLSLVITIPVGTMEDIQTKYGLTDETYARVKAEAIAELRAELMNPEGRANLIAKLRDDLIAEAKTGVTTTPDTARRLSPEEKAELMSPEERAEFIREAKDEMMRPEVRAELRRANMMAESLAEVKANSWFCCLRK